MLSYTVDRNLYESALNKRKEHSMKKFILLFLILTLIFGILASCDKSESKGSETSEITDTSDTDAVFDHQVVRAKIIEISGNSVLIEPLEGEPERASADRIWVNIDGFSDVGAEIGSTVDITYDGYIMETYPAQIRASAWSLVN